MSFNPCALIPVFNHHVRLGQIVASLTAAGLPVILVDDGSDSTTRAKLAEIVSAEPLAECIALPQNHGKGAAFMIGIAHAGDRGFTHALQVDADGQHDLADFPALLSLAAQHPDKLVSGMPVYDDSVPAVRFYGRYLTHMLIWLDTLSFSLRDSMCGFRVYPVAPCLTLARRTKIGQRMDFDTDIMTRLYWMGTESLFVPTKVRYPEDGVSHYRMFADNARMTWLHVRLFTGMLPRMPKLLFRNVTRLEYRHWARITESGSMVGLRFMEKLDRWLGRPTTRAVLYPVTVWFFFTHTRARRASRQFLAAAGMRPTLRNGLRHFGTFSESILDKVLAWYAPERIKMDISACTPIAEALANQRGGLLLTAHLGNAEVARAMTGLMPGLRINALVHTRNSRKFNAVLEDTTADYGVNLLQVEDFSIETGLMLRDRIAKGEFVAIVGDRIPVTGETAVTLADFLGQPARFPIGPYVLAHLLECPVYLFFCMRVESGYQAYVEPFADCIHLPRGNRAQVTASWASRYADRLGDYARRFPLQWYNFHDFWHGATIQQDEPAAAHPDETALKETEKEMPRRITTSGGMYG